MVTGQHDERAGLAKGIGLAIAELFAAEGANVAICARNAEEVGKVVKRSDGGPYGVSTVTSSASSRNE